MLDPFAILKNAAEVAKTAGKVELYAQVLDIQANVLQMQRERLVDHQVIESLRAELRSVREQLATRNALVAGRNSYWMADASKRYGWDGPFCTGCWDGSQKLARLSFDYEMLNCHCPVCKSRFERPVTPYGAIASRDNWLMPAPTPPAPSPA